MEESSNSLYETLDGVLNNQYEEMEAEIIFYLR